MIFFLNLDQGSPSTLGADIERNYVKNYEQSNLESNAYAKRQMETKKKEKCEVILQKVEMYKEKKNVEKCKKNHQEKKRFEGGSKSK